jgi:hypothetical protein
MLGYHTCHGRGHFSIVIQLIDAHGNFGADRAYMTFDYFDPLLVC